MAEPGKQRIGDPPQGDSLRWRIQCAGRTFLIYARTKPQAVTIMDRFGTEAGLTGQAFAIDLDPDEPVSLIDNMIGGA